MDSSEIVYVVASDDDLPISLQLLHDADGTLHPQILPESSSHCSSSDHSVIIVYDNEGNDIAEAVTIEAYEYIVDENGKAFCLSNRPSKIPPLNCLAAASSTDCSKSVTLEDIKEANVVTNLKTCGAQRTFSQADSDTRLHNDVTVTAAESVQVNENLKGVVVTSCEKASLHNSTCLDSATEMMPKVNENIDTASAPCEEYTSSVCVNDSQSSRNLQSENSSIPSSPENLCQGTLECVTEVKLPSNRERFFPVCVANAEKCPNRDIDMLAASCASDITKRSVCGPVSNLAAKQCCSNFSSKCHLTYEAASFCRNSADQLELNCVSSTCVFAESSCNVKPASGNVSLFTDYKADSASHTHTSREGTLCMHASQEETPLAEGAGDCNSENYNQQFPDSQNSFVDGCDNGVHCVSSCSPVIKSISCELSRVATVGVTNAVFPCDVLRSDVGVSKPEHANCISEAVTANDDLTSVNTERAEQCFNSETEGCNSLIDTVTHNEIKHLCPTTDYSVDATENTLQQKDSVALQNDLVSANDVARNKNGQDFADTCANTEYHSSQAYTTNCLHNENCQDDSVNSTLSSTLDTASTVACESCPLSELSNRNIGDSLSCDSSAIPECTKNQPCNGYQLNMPEVVSNSSNSIQEMRQSLRILHRTRHHLRKLQQTRQPRIEVCLDMLDSVNCIKRLRLEAIDCELTKREMMLQRRDEELNVRQDRIEQYEQALCDKDQLITQELSDLSLPLVESPKLTAGNQSQLLAKYECDVAESNQKSTHPHTTQRGRPRRMCRKKAGGDTATLRNLKQRSKIVTDMDKSKRMCRSANRTKT